MIKLINSFGNDGDALSSGEANMLVGIFYLKEEPHKKKNVTD